MPRPLTRSQLAFREALNSAIANDPYACVEGTEALSRYRIASQDWCHQRTLSEDGRDYPGDYDAACRERDAALAALKAEVARVQSEVA